MSEIVFLGERDNSVERVFAMGRKEHVQSLGKCVDGIVGTHNLDLYKKQLVSVRYAFGSWGMPHFSAEQIREYFPALEGVFYAAGSVKEFAEEYLSCGVRVFSAWTVNAIPVAETVFAQITLANKGFFQTLNKRTQAEKNKAAAVFQGNFAVTVGIIGMGMIGSMVAEKLKALSVRVVAFDPFLSEERAAEYNVQKTDLNTLFSESDVITNHLANNPQTRGMLNYGCFSRMKPHAVFINSGRGAQVREPDLVRALQEQPERFAILDVTDPEPPREDSPLYQTPNVLLTPHLDGSWGSEVVRMADEAIRAFSEFRAGQPTRCEVTREMLATMA